MAQQLKENKVQQLKEEEEEEEDIEQTLSDLFEPFKYHKKKKINKKKPSKIDLQKCKSILSRKPEKIKLYKKNNNNNHHPVVPITNNDLCFFKHGEAPKGSEHVTNYFDKDFVDLNGKPIIIYPHTSLIADFIESFSVFAKCAGFFSPHFEIPLFSKFSRDLRAHPSECWKIRNVEDVQNLIKEVMTNDFEFMISYAEVLSALFKARACNFKSRIEIFKTVLYWWWPTAYSFVPQSCEYNDDKSRNKNKY